MIIKVQKQKPSRNEGSEGEMRLVTTGRGTFLYVRDINQWYSLRLSPTTASNTHARLNRGILQTNVLTIAGSGDSDHDGSILPGFGGSSGPPSGGDEPR